MEVTRDYNNTLAPTGLADLAEPLASSKADYHNAMWPRGRSLYSKKSPCARVRPVGPRMSFLGVFRL